VLLGRNRSAQMHSAWEAAEEQRLTSTETADGGAASTSELRSGRRRRERGDGRGDGGAREAVETWRGRRGDGGGTERGAAVGRARRGLRLLSGRAARCG
jgi:hypothetical protein